MSRRNERSTQPDLDGVTNWLILQAARRAPGSLSSRLEEEWLADLESRSCTLSRLRFAVGCCWATLVLVSDYPRSEAAAASPAVAARGFITFADRDLGYFSRRSGTLFLVAGLHAALFYGLITTLSHTRVLATLPNLQNQVVKSVPPEKLPQPLPPQIRMIDAPKLVIDAPPKIVVDEDVPTQVVEKSLEASSPLTSDPTTVKSSGSARLDEGALKLARAGSGHYRAATEDGRPVNSCYPLGIRFQLKK
jgi:hypothetical protein